MARVRYRAARAPALTLPRVLNLKTAEFSAGRQSIFFSRQKKIKLVKIYQQSSFLDAFSVESILIKIVYAFSGVKLIGSALKTLTGCAVDDLKRIWPPQNKPGRKQQKPILNKSQSSTLWLRLSNPILRHGIFPPPPAVRHKSKST